MAVYRRQFYFKRFCYSLVLLCCSCLSVPILPSCARIVLLQLVLLLPSVLLWSFCATRVLPCLLCLSICATLVFLCYSAAPHVFLCESFLSVLLSRVSCLSMLLLSFYATIVFRCYSCLSVLLLSFCVTIVFLCYSCLTSLVFRCEYDALSAQMGGRWVGGGRR